MKHPLMNQNLPYLTLMTSHFSIGTTISDFERGLPSGDSFSSDRLSNILIYLALIYRELRYIKNLDSNSLTKNVQRDIENLFSRIIYVRAVFNKDIDETYLTRYGRINYENENTD